MDAVTQVFGAAVPIIERRLELHALLSEDVGLQAPLSEDGFRYLVFDEFRKAGVDIMRVALEYPRDVHAKGVDEPNDRAATKPKGVRPKIDTVILDDAKAAPETAIEFKYIRKHGAPSADAGGLLADFTRLRDFDFPNGEVDRFVALLTDGELWEYLNDPCKGLSWLLCESEQEISKGKIPCGKGTINLRKRAGDWRSPVRAQVTGRWEVGSDHKLVVWRAWRVET